MRACIVALAVGLAALGVGCSPYTCDRSPKDNPDTPYKEGTVVGGVYMSSPWSGPLLFFPGGMRYVIYHQLGTVPRWWQVYLSFDPGGARAELDAGANDGGPDAGTSGTLAQAAGNMAEVVQVNDQTLTVINGTCSEFWILITAGAGDRASSPAPPP